MSRTAKWMILTGLTLAGMILLWMQPAIPQDPAFHAFADHRDFFSLHNAWNVFSNIPFVVIGSIGLFIIRGTIMDSNVRRAYTLLFAGILLTGAGSAYYHWSPGNATLVYDRIPMTIVFMSFFSIVVMEWIDSRAGAKLLVPLVITGIASVLWWHFSELAGKGDLRWYLFVQFYPMLIIPVIFILFHAPGKARKLSLLIGVIGWYIVAKVLEQYDESVFTALGFISGHSLKHLAAAISTLYLLLFFKARYLSVTTSPNI